MVKKSENKKTVTNRCPFGRIIPAILRIIAIERKIAYIKEFMEAESLDPKIKQNIEGVINEADGALYKSKEHGRNRITIFDPDAKEFKELSSG